jgi:hypothetical protein
VRHQVVEVRLQRKTQQRDEVGAGAGGVLEAFPLAPDGRDTLELRHDAGAPVAVHVARVRVHRDGRAGEGELEATSHDAGLHLGLQTHRAPGGAFLQRQRFKRVRAVRWKQEGKERTRMD